jgi:undecaprenyl-diphosphatase
MKKETFKKLIIPILSLALFILLTILLQFVDVKPIGPNNSTVGFAFVNGFVHNFTGTNMLLYIITDWLGLVPIAFAFGFAVLGLVQLIKRESLKNVDYNLFVLGGFYIVVMAVYVLFEIIPINYRPVLINGFLEVSYPSSTTMLTMCIMPTSLMQLNSRIKNKTFKRIVEILVIMFTAFMVLARLVSGVHWLTDIIAGALISISLTTTYSFLTKLK